MGEAPRARLREEGRSRNAGAEESAGVAQPRPGTHAPPCCDPPQRSAGSSPPRWGRRARKGGSGSQRGVCERCRLSLCQPLAPRASPLLFSFSPVLARSASACVARRRADRSQEAAPSLVRPTMTAARRDVCDGEEEASARRTIFFERFLPLDAAARRPNLAPGAGRWRPPASPDPPQVRQLCPSPRKARRALFLVPAPPRFRPSWPRSRPRRASLLTCAWCPSGPRSRRTWL